MGQNSSKSSGPRKKQPVSTAATPARVEIAPDKATVPPNETVRASQTSVPAPGPSSRERLTAAHSSSRPIPNPQSIDQRITNPQPGGRSTPDPGPSSQRTPDPHSIDQRVIHPYPVVQRPPDPSSNGQSTPDLRPSSQPIDDGIYIITNAYHGRFVYLQDANDNTPIKGHFRRGHRNAQWHVKNYENDEYSIENVEHNRYADSGNLAVVKAHVEGSSEERLWYIKALPTGEYTIATTDTKRVWMLPYNDPETPVELSDVYKDRRCLWTFKQAEIGAPANKPTTTLPFEQKLPPVPFGGQPIPETALLEFTSAITETIDLLPPLRAACGALRVVLHRAESIGHVNEDQKALVKRLKFHLTTIKIHIAQLEEDQKIDKTSPALNQDVRESLETYAREFSEIPELLLVNQPKSSSPVNMVTRKTRKTDEAFQKYTTALHRFAASTVNQMPQSLAQFRPPEKSHSADEGARRIQPNAYGIQHRECLEGTREKTLPAISEWVDDKHTEKWIFFFLDVAGSGKSTVAKHMAEKWKRENRLLARFFFSRDTKATMSTDSFCSTVAGAYADLDENYKHHMDKFMARPNVELLSFEERFEGLVVRPLSAIGRQAVIVIDALDECHPEQRDQMLETLRTQHSSVPLLRVFVTGRPERDIKRWASIEFRFGYVNFIRLEESDKDVQTYIEHRLQGRPIAQDRLYPVIHNAEGLFIWARVACDLLLDCDDIDGLLEILGKEVSLDYLYRVALGQSMPKEEASRRAMVLVLQMILAAREPLSIAELELLSPKRGVVENVVTRLGSVLLYQGREDPIRLLHATFREFLTTRSKANIFFIQLELGHHTLASGCLNIMSHLSKQDDTTLRNVDRISDRKMISCFGKILIDSVSRTFVYSSESWVHHCLLSYRKLALNKPTLEFANGGLKTWIGLVNDWKGVDTLDCVRNVLLLSPHNMSPQVTEMLVSQSLQEIVRA